MPLDVRSAIKPLGVMVGTCAPVTGGLLKQTRFLRAQKKTFSKQRNPAAIREGGLSSSSRSFVWYRTQLLTAHTQGTTLGKNKGIQLQHRQRPLPG